MPEDHSHKHSGHTHVGEVEDKAYTNLVGLHEQSTLNIKSYKLQYSMMFIFLLFVIFLTIRAFSNPFPYFIESSLCFAFEIILLNFSQTWNH